MLCQEPTVPRHGRLLYYRSLHTLTSPLTLTIAREIVTHFSDARNDKKGGTSPALVGLINQATTSLNGVDQDGEMPDVPYYSDNDLEQLVR